MKNDQDKFYKESQRFVIF